MTALDDTDHRAAMFVVADYLRHRPAAPQSLWRLRQKLDGLIRHPVSPPGQRNARGAEELVRTQTAATMLGWHPRKLRRHKADLDGRLVGDRLMFPRRAVEEYARALRDKEVQEK